MTYRILCDENVPEETVGRLHRRDIEAAHVSDSPGTGSTDEQVAAHARERDHLLLTNDTDFLDRSAYPEVSVLYYPDNEAPPHEITRRVEDLVALVPNPADLGRVTFLTDS